jgi:hypothetical protein
MTTPTQPSMYQNDLFKSVVSSTERARARWQRERGKVGVLQEVASAGARVAQEAAARPQRLLTPAFRPAAASRSYLNRSAMSSIRDKRFYALSAITFLFYPFSTCLVSVQHGFHHVVIKIQQIFLQPTCLASTYLETGVETIANAAGTNSLTCTCLRSMEELEIINIDHRFGD